MEYTWLSEVFEDALSDMTQKKRDIVKASVILFNEKGYAGTSTKEIAQLAGVSEGTIFKHFSSKRELMLSVVSLIIDRVFLLIFLKGLPELLNKEYETLDDFIDALLKNRIPLIEKAVPLYKILIQELPFHQEIRSMMRLKISEIPLFQMASQLSIKGMEKLKFGDDALLSFVTCFSGFVQTRFVLMPEYFERIPHYNREQDLKQFVQFILQGFGLQTNMPSLMQPLVSENERKEGGQK